MDYKEGKDFKWVPMKDKKGNIVKDGKGNPVKTRKFFTKAEKDQMKEKSKSETKGKSETKSESPAPKSTSKRPQARRTEGQIRSSSGGRTRYSSSTKDNSQDRDPKNYTSSGRGKGMYELGRRKTEQSDYKDGKLKTKTETSRFPGLERIRSMFNWGLNGTPSAGSKKRTQTTKSNYTKEDLDRRSGGRRTGMAKGGMVKSGNKDYKNSGMFYKSGSPRGYK